jgi:ubiquinone/menaquinone biosynthesis C-methylase UbiE
MTNCPSGWWGDHVDVRFYVYKRLQQLRGKRVLDIACGGGILLTALDASNEAHGLELDHSKAAAARKLTKAKIVEGSMLKLPYKNGYFDVVVLTNVLPGFDFAGTEKERHKAVAEAKRVLRKGGTLLLTTPNAEWYRTEKADEADLEPLLEGTAYKVRGWNPFPRWLPTRLLALVPGMMNWLEKDMLNNEPNGRKSFYVEAVKL